MNFTVYISQDGENQKVVQMLNQELPDLFHGIKTKHFMRKRGLAPGSPAQTSRVYLSQHYRHIINRVFNEFQHSHVILLEDDMIVSPDFIHFFEQTAPLLDQDPSLMCISTWNDNGKSLFDIEDKKSQLFRTSFFPGLGWMMKRDLWNQIGPSFPLDNWDWWMRGPDISQDRECVVPYVSRNYNIGVYGANLRKREYNAQLKDIVYNENDIIALGDLSYLLKSNYELKMIELIQEAEQLSHDFYQFSSLPSNQGKIYLIPFTTGGFHKIRDALKIWDQGRTFHQYSTVLYYDGNIIILAHTRLCPYLHYASSPLTSSLQPAFTSRDPSLRPIPAPIHTSCDQVCSANNMKEKGVCDSEHFVYVNDCHLLREYFGCENGCRWELGGDIPNYVPVKSNPNYGQCLITYLNSFDCGAKHKETQRLCPCLIK